MESKKHGMLSNLIYVLKPAVKAKPVLLFALLPLAASATTSMVWECWAGRFSLRR